MRILFCHRSYPAQFGRLAARLADRGHQITYAAEQFSHRHCPWPDGWLLQLQPPGKTSEPDSEPLLHEWTLGVKRSRRIHQLLRQLSEAHRAPELVIYQAGLGYGLALRPLLPNLPLVAYAEWFFRPELLHWLVKDPTPDDYCMLSPRNALILQELSDADQIVSPTTWQRDQFPELFRLHIEVLFDGIDTSFFYPDLVHGPVRLPIEAGGTVLIEPSHQLLTYATRGMEPIRGFPELMTAIPDLMKFLPRLHVVIAGRDRQAYSYAAPDHHGSWKKTFLETFQGAAWVDRLHFTGLLPYSDYRQLLRRSDLHCSFSRPYVPSWSLMEAAACGAPLALNKGPASYDILPNAAHCVIDLDSPPSIVQRLIRGLCSTVPLVNRHSTLPFEFCLQSCLERWESLLSPWLKS